MKTFCSFILAVGLLAGSAQATLITECATLIGNTDKKPFTGKNHTTYEAWALGIIGDTSVGPFTKVDTSTPQVMLTDSDKYIMLHWGNGKSGDHAYELYDVSGCAGKYYLPAPSQNGLSWIGRLRGGSGGGGTGNGNGVPDGGTTLILLGGALCALAPAKKLLGK